MKLFGSIKELVAAVFRKDSFELTLRPNQSTTLTAARDVQLPPGDFNHALVSATSSQILTDKTIDGDDNTLSDISIGSLKTVLGDANEALVRDGSGVVTSALLIDANVDAAAGIDTTKLANGSVSNAEFQLIGTRGTDASGELVVTDSTQVLTNKTIDGDSNTVQDLPETAIKTNLTNASKFFTRDVSGIPESASKAVPGGAVVGTSDIQTLTGKVYEGGTASANNRFTIPKAAKATLDGLTRQEGTLVYATDNAKPYFDNGSALVDFAGAAAGGTYTTKSANYTVLDGDGFRTIDVTTGASAITITLPTAADNTDRIITIRKEDTGTGNVVVDGEGSETVDSDVFQLINNVDQTLTVMSTGTGWKTIQSVKPGQVPGSRTGTATATGFLGEIVTGTVGSGAVTSQVVKNFASITLNKGVWLVTGQAYVLFAGPTSTNLFRRSISTTSSTMDFTRMESGSDTFTGGDNCGQVTSVINVAADSTTYYLNVFIVLFTAGASVQVANTSLTSVRIG